MSLSNHFEMGPPIWTKGLNTSRTTLLARAGAWASVVTAEDNEYDMSRGASASLYRSGDGV